MLNARTDREVTRVNTFEARWRIHTNLAKFTVIPIATRNPPPLMIDGENVPYKRSGSMLGIHVTGRGYTANITARVNKAKACLTRLLRFKDLEIRIKLHLIKTMIIPILTYPPVPTHALSNTAIQRLQRVQNSALKYAYGHRWDSFITMEELHTQASMPAINVRLHELARRVWERLENLGGPQYERLQNLHRNYPDNNHNWFPRSIPRLQGHEPEPRYT